VKAFTEEFKKMAVQKYLSRGTRSVAEVCEELGIAKPTIFQWAIKYGNKHNVNIKDRRPQDWTAEEKNFRMF
jgi:transposase-like protein